MALTATMTVSWLALAKTNRWVQAGVTTAIVVAMMVAGQALGILD